MIIKSIQSKEHFKMYKSGKQWIVCGIAVLGTAISLTTYTTAQADTTTPVVDQTTTAAVSSATPVADSTAATSTVASDVNTDVAVTNSSDATAPVVDSAATNNSVPTINADVQNDTTTAATSAATTETTPTVDWDNWQDSSSIGLGYNILVTTDGLAAGEATGSYHYNNTFEYVFNDDAAAPVKKIITTNDIGLSLNLTGVNDITRVGDWTVTSPTGETVTIPAADITISMVNGRVALSFDTQKYAAIANTIQKLNYTVAYDFDATSKELGKDLGTDTAYTDFYFTYPNVGEQGQIIKVYYRDATTGQDVETSINVSTDIDGNDLYLNSSIASQNAPTIDGYTFDKAILVNNDGSVISSIDEAGNTISNLTITTAKQALVFTYKQNAGAVTVNNVDDQGNALGNGSVTYTDGQFVGSDYSTTPTAIKGYTFSKIATGSATATGDLSVNPQTVTYVYTKNAPIITTDTVNKTVHYVDADGNKLADDFTSSADFTTSTDAVTGVATTTPVSDILGHQANPVINGYTVTTNPTEATTDQTVKSGDTDTEYTVVYTKNASTTTTDTVNKTVHYVDADGNKLADDFTSSADFTTSTDAVTGKTTTTSTNDVLGHQANPVINGYTVTTNPTEATTDQTVKSGDTDTEYTVVYTKNAPTTTTDTVNKTVHYVDADGNKLADDFTSSADFTTSTDAVTGKTTTTSTNDVLGHQANPVINGYTVTTNPTEATTDQTAKLGDTDTEYNVVYTKNSPTITTDTVNKTVHYVDVDGNKMADDFTSSANFTTSTDAVTGKATTTSTNDVLGHQANPVINGYTVTTNPAAATTDQTVKSGDTDTEYTVVYTKNSPTTTTDTVNKIVHYVDADGNQLANDFTSSADFTSSTDAVTGKTTTTSTNDVLGHQANPVINGYTITTNPTEATTDQTVKSGDTDTEYTVVYTKNAPIITTDTVNKTVHYVDADGNKLADDFTSSADFTTSTDAVTGKTTTSSTNDVLGHQVNPEIPGYTVTTNPAEATTDQTVKSGDTDAEYTVIYTKNTPTTTTDTVNKTIHYVDADGNQLANDFTSQADFTTSTDAVTGKTTTTSTNDILGHQANPVINGYTVTTNPAQATTDQTAKLGDTDAEYTVVYTKNAPTTTTDTTTPKTTDEVSVTPKQPTVTQPVAVIPTAPTKNTVTPVTTTANPVVTTTTNTLPQTGEKSSPLMLVAGLSMLMMIMSFLGIEIKKQH